MFSDSRVIELSRRFVCVADEVWRLQRGSERDSLFFQRAVNGGRRITDRRSRQGMWILTPGGTVLAHANTRAPGEVLRLFERGLQAWEELGEEARAAHPGETGETGGIQPEHRWEASVPEDGLVLERVARDIGPEAPAGHPVASWNLDHVWFSADEVASLVPRHARPAQRFELPLLARRLARFHLVDNVRGQTLPYAEEQVREATLSARVASRRGERIELVLEGRTRAVAEGPWRMGENSWKPEEELPRGIQCELLGRAVFDAALGRFESFELVAVGRRFGRTTHNGRPAPEPPAVDAGRLAFWLSPAPRGTRVPPAFVSLYDGSWIERPAVSTWRLSPGEVRPALGAARDAR